MVAARPSRLSHLGRLGHNENRNCLCFPVLYGLDEHFRVGFPLSNTSRLYISLKRPS